MAGFLGEAYLWVKALHIIAVIAWMAGMLYLPRLYVYHCEAEPGSPQSETFKIMERRLLRAIINPAMIVAWISAVLMVKWLIAWFGTLQTGADHVYLRDAAKAAGAFVGFSVALGALACVDRFIFDADEEA